mgnify:CR=1 FL=1
MKKLGILLSGRGSNFEAIAAADPDVILAHYSGITEKQYDDLYVKEGDQRLKARTRTTRINPNSGSTSTTARWPATLSEGRPTPYGMGWLAEFHPRGPLADRWYVLAFGSLRGFRAGFHWFEEEDLLVAWAANSDAGAVTDALLGLPQLVVMR